jgi:hypothetical protein
MKDHTEAGVEFIDRLFRTIARVGKQKQTQAALPDGDDQPRGARIRSLAYRHDRLERLVGSDGSSKVNSYARA